MCRHLARRHESSPPCVEACRLLARCRGENGDVTGECEALERAVSESRSVCHVCGWSQSRRDMMMWAEGEEAKPKEAARARAHVVAERFHSRVTGSVVCAIRARTRRELCAHIWPCRACVDCIDSPPCDLCGLRARGIHFRLARCRLPASSLRGDLGRPPRGVATGPGPCFGLLLANRWHSAARHLLRWFDNVVGIPT